MFYPCDNNHHPQKGEVVSPHSLVVGRTHTGPEVIHDLVVLLNVIPVSKWVIQQGNIIHNKYAEIVSTKDIRRIRIEISHGVPTIKR